MRSNPMQKTHLEEIYPIIWLLFRHHTLVAIVLLHDLGVILGPRHHRTHVSVVCRVTVKCWDDLRYTPIQII